ALVLAAEAFVILGRAKDARTEQTVPFRLERPVVDGFRLLDLAERPRPDLFGARERDADLVEGRGGDHRIEDVQDFLAHWASSSSDGMDGDEEGLTAPPPAKGVADFR